MKHKIGVSLAKSKLIHKEVSKGMGSDHFKNIDILVKTPINLYLKRGYYARHIELLYKVVRDLQKDLGKKANKIKKVKKNDSSS